MMWALVLLIAVVVGVHWWEYSRTVQEYTFAQPAKADGDLRGVLAEKTPLAVEIGELPWRPEVAEKSTWTVKTTSDTADMSYSVAEWLRQKGGGEATITNGRELAAEMGLSTGLADVDGARAWWWLPGIWDEQVDVLEPGQVAGLRWVGAEREWVGCSHGGPLTLWLVHSRYRRYLPEPAKSEDAIDPWTLTPKEAPWIGRVHYVEVAVRPGWVISLPANWGYAVRGAAEEASWWWSAAQHSVVSLAATRAS
jgi:hypothetical protein